jgi:hypothetical protein
MHLARRNFGLAVTRDGMCRGDGTSPEPTWPVTASPHQMPVRMPTAFRIWPTGSYQDLPELASRITRCNCAWS